MKKIVVGLALFFFASAIFVFADASLVEAAKKEKARRAKITKPAQVITNQTIEDFVASGKVVSGTIETTGGAEAAPTEATTAADQKKTAEEREQLKLQLADAQRKITDAQNRVKQLEARATNNLYNPGIGQLTGQASADADELAQTKQSVAEAQAAAEGLQKQIRMLGPE